MDNDAKNQHGEPENQPSEPVPNVPNVPNQVLLEGDINGAGKSAGKAGMSIKGEQSARGPRLSNFFVQASVVAICLVAVLVWVGIKGAPAGNKKDSSASDMPGQTPPDLNAILQAAQKKTGYTAPAAPASPPQALVKLAGGDLGHGSNGPPKRLTEAQKYKKWLVKQHYKSLEGVVLADQSAHLATIGTKGGGGMGGGYKALGGAGNGLANAFRSVGTMAAIPQGVSAPAPQAVRGMPGGGAGQEGGAQEKNKAFLAGESGDNASSGYLDAFAQPPISDHELFAGSVIPAIMLTGIDSDLPGTISAQVRQTIYDSLNPGVVLIPQGARLVGAYSSDVAYGQSRVLVAWNRLIFPNGAMIDLKGMSGTDGLGQAGMHDQVDNHYMRIFGSTVLMSLLGVGAQLSQPQNAGTQNTPSASQQAAAALAQGLDSAGTNLLNKNLSINPTLNIRPGYAFNVLVNRTMILPPYLAQ